MSAPVWLTQAGFIGTVTERVTTSTSILASGGAVSYQIINGALPGGLQFTSTGTIYGTPYSVGLTLSNEFVVRASNTNGVTDRTFIMDVAGPSDPIWVTPGSTSTNDLVGFLAVGFSGQYYAINGQYIIYQLSAYSDALPPGQKLRYFIADYDGELPPGVTLLENGKLTGKVSDKLKLTYKVSSEGGFDEEPYDEFPYDHVLIKETGYGTSVKFVSKTYQFYVTVTDGVSSSRRLFKIKVEDPSSLRSDSSFIISDTNFYLSDSGYLISPQWLTPANLGYVRANNKQIIILETYDFNTNLGPVTYTTQGEEEWITFNDYYKGTVVKYNGDTYICKIDHASGTSFDSSKWKVNRLPPNFKLDSTYGYLYATLPYQPAYSIDYSFTIFAIKTDLGTGDNTRTAQEFFLTVKGDVESTIQFTSNEYIGTLNPGYQSELKVVAEHIGSNFSIQYELIDGALPTGLTLLPDGTIAGTIAYGNQLLFKDITLDGGTTTFDKVRRFTIRATDIYLSSAVEKEFYMIVQADNNIKYTTIYAQPLLNLAQRRLYADFVNNPYTFDPALIYRYQDPAFGVQTKIQMYIEHGIQQVKLDLYADALRKYFYKKRFYLGDVKWSKATDSDGNYVYDIVYVEVKDPLQNSQGEGIVGPRNFSGVDIYPNSINNMKNNLAAIKIRGETITTDEFLLPRFMRTIQPDSGSPLGFILAVPICYALPEKGQTIVQRIGVDDFDFRHIDFEIDRVIVRDNLSDEGAKYLLFPRKDVNGANLGQDLSTLSGKDGVILEVESGVPLELEI